MGSTRIKSNRLSFRLGDGEADFWADLSEVVMDADRTYVPLLAGGYRAREEWFFDVSAIQSTAPGSFWTFLFDHAGEMHPFGYAPHGNPIPTVDEPHFTGIVQMPARPSLGGAASPDGEYSFDARLFIISGPLRVTE
ncbi:hypothetical protein FE374_09370 [Georgenia yuyongxinii]|uniref:Uncharacterized protein n=1 Tax=Georgenia yuyongxinii TaxID=2589797 RepID=A0A5B8C2L9_9MICO|nr:hypothetical protein [Georgenia yuyongxinii]QDC24794.1 hypothetical protein FE374_09370 [Georgenia yuyongxinii]